MESRNTRDGRWHASDRPQQTTARVKVYRNISARIVFRGTIFRWLPEVNRFEQDWCLDNHQNRRTANECAVRWARRWNAS